MRTWMRLEGRLWEDLTFEPGTGWETDVIARRPPEGDGTWMVELLDDKGQVVFDTSPVVRFARPPGTPPGRMHAARVVAYLPTHPEGRRIRLRRRDFVVYARPVAAAAPGVTITHQEVTEDREVVLHWEPTDGPGRPLVYRVVYQAEGRGVFPVARDLLATSLRIPLRQLPGSPRGRLAVMATDGLRSSFAQTETFAVPHQPARVAILEPHPYKQVPFNHPLTLRGVAHDDAGRRLDDTGFVWMVDGQLLARETNLALAARLTPGEHTIVLAWEGAGAPRAETRVIVRVTPPQRPDGPSEPPPEPAPDRNRPPSDGPLRIKL